MSLTLSGERAQRRGRGHAHATGRISDVHGNGEYTTPVDDPPAVCGVVGSSGVNRVY